VSYEESCETTEGPFLTVHARETRDYGKINIDKEESARVAGDRQRSSPAHVNTEEKHFLSSLVHDI
jgi:hypothetical protein